MGVNCNKLCNLGDIQEGRISNPEELTTAKEINQFNHDLSIEACQMTANDTQAYKAKPNGHDRLKGGKYNKGKNINSTIDESLYPIETIYYPNGDSYTGHVFNNTREDRGKLTFAFDKGYYEGNFHNNLYEGYGVLKIENYIYYGNWLKGKKYGEGRLENIKENTYYIGFWENDIKHGPGIETFDDGSYFEGNYFQNQKSSNVHISFDEAIEEEKSSFLTTMNRNNGSSTRTANLRAIGIHTHDSEKFIGNNKLYKNM